MMSSSTVTRSSTSPDPLVDRSELLCPSLAGQKFVPAENKLLARETNYAPPTKLESMPDAQKRVRVWVSVVNNAK